LVELDGHSLTIKSAVGVAEGGEAVKVKPSSLSQMVKFRSLLERKLASGETVYGVNTGFGSLSDKAVKAGDLKELQVNLIRSHSAGVGNPMPLGVVRGAMLIRLNSLLNGNSAARKEIAEALVGLLNKGVTPLVPEFGSLGSSGDLVPSAHMALTMVGEGNAYYGGRLMESSQALSEASIQPVVLHAKEGLSLINGTAFTTALGCIAVHRGDLLLDAANSAVALSAEASRACSQSFDERLVGTKLDPGQRHVAARIRELLKGSQRIRGEPTPQDPYSIRCAPQVHGSLRDALDFAEKIVVNEMNSNSDNPILMDDGAVLHGGNFHGQPVSMALDLLSIAICYLGVVSLARIHFLLSRTPTDARFATKRPGLESGLMVLEYTATSLAADNSRQVYPESTYPANVSGGVEDHASHGVNAGTKALDVADNISRILAIELICASNVLGTDTKGLSESSKKLTAFVRQHSPQLSGDRSQAQEIESLSKATLAGGLSQAMSAENTSSPALKTARTY
jgi:histidine ammonia-lyase